MIAWVFAPGCVGKKTFIWNAVKASAHEEYAKYKLALGFSLSETVLPVLPSIYMDDGSKLPENSNQRFRRRYEILASLINMPFNLIIHGQWPDDQHLINKLVSKDQRCYYLETTEFQYKLNRVTRGVKPKDYKKLIQTWESKVIPKLESVFGSIQRIKF